MAKNDLSRRDFLLRFGAVGALGVGAGSVLAACGGGESGSQTTPPPSEPETAGQAAEAAAACDDLTGLTEQEIAMRTQLQYVAQTPDPARPCTACALYIPAPEGEPCGGCNLIKGPIAPNGYCISWAPKQT